MPEVAADHFKQALIADPECPSAFFGLYSLSARSNDPDQAISYANYFLEAAPDDNPLRQEVESNVVKLKKQIGKQKHK
jgi:cytochrome c-type biogenesis protein CcmH/NrfG